MSIQERLAEYHSASQAGAKVCNAACVKASNIRDEEYALLKKSAQKDDCAAILRIERRYDIACQKADKVYGALMGDLYQMLQGKESTEVKQLALF